VTCGAGGDTRPTKKGEGANKEPQSEAEVPTPSPAAPSHHCRTDRAVRFACPLDNGRILNVCEMETGLSVRLGPTGKIVFQYPPNNVQSNFTYIDQPIGGSHHQGLTFTWKAKEYTLREISYEGKMEEAGLIVANKKGDILPESGTCSGAIIRNWVAIQRMHNFEFSDGPP
jgi:hypothetical protein